ncbi:protein misato homolog 1 isoform X1 [Pelobates fuscus]|uniref:protein misato homolog 1 isoform X1 n=1 Tax=Pelobates fuscus TaxID=191477 RepID=UPI002FE4B0B5
MGEQCGEVLTLQLGHYASFVGTHWWNSQNTTFSNPLGRNVEPEICSKVLFRHGVTLKGMDTYTPRLIIMDLKGSLSSLREEGYLYEDKDTRSSTPAWRGCLTTHLEDPPVQKPFLEDIGMKPLRQKGETVSESCVSGMSSAVGSGLSTLSSMKSHNLEKSVNVWSDFLQTDLHPKSVCVVNQYNHGGEIEGLESFSQGQSILKDASYLEDIEDRLHFFIEECDYLQGFQLLCDLHDGFSGLGAQMAEFLHDEYPGRGILTWGTCPVQSGERNMHKAMFQMMNVIMGLVKMSSLSTLFCPLSLNSSLGRRPGPPTSFPHLLYNPALQYHSSSILAIALDTITAPYRVPASHLSMQDMAESLNFCGRKVVSAAASLPFPIEVGSSLPDALSSHLAAAPWSSLSPCGTRGSGGKTECFSQSVVLRGISKDKQNSNLSSGIRSSSALYSQSTGEDVLQCYLQALYPAYTVSIPHVFQDPCRLGPSFPQFFSPVVTREGFTQSMQCEPPQGVDCVPMFTALQTSKNLYHMLRGLYEETRKVDVRRFSTFFSSGVEMDDFEEALQQLRDLAQCYSSADDEMEEDD